MSHIKRNRKSQELQITKQEAYTFLLDARSSQSKQTKKLFTLKFDISDNTFQKPSSE